MRGRHAFDHDELIQTWVVHHVEIIGEACSLVSEGFRASHPEIPWKKIIGMRNVLVHHYFGIDEDLVWDAVERELVRPRTDRPELMLGSKRPGCPSINFASKA